MFLNGRCVEHRSDDTDSAVGCLAVFEIDSDAPVKKLNTLDVMQRISTIGPGNIVTIGCLLKGIICIVTTVAYGINMGGAIGTNTEYLGFDCSSAEIPAGTT